MKKQEKTKDKNKENSKRKIIKDVNNKINKLSEKIDIILVNNKKKININDIATKSLLISVITIFSSIFLLKLSLSSVLVQKKVLEYIVSGIPLLNLANGDILYTLFINFENILKIKSNTNIYGYKIGLILYFQNKLKEYLKTMKTENINITTQIPGSFPVDKKNIDDEIFYDALEDFNNNDNYFKKFIKLKPNINKWFNYIIFKK